MEASYNPASDENMGAMVLGLALSLVLFGVVIIQCYAYCQRVGSDSMFIKVLVIAVLSLEILHSIMITIMIYRSTLTLAGVSTHGPNSNVLTTSIVFEVLITAVVQGFFAFRIYRLSGTLYVSCVCWALSLLRLGGGLAFAAESYLDVPRVPNTILLTTMYGWLITLSLIVGACVDVLIAASLCYYLKKMVAPKPLKSTSQLVDRLVSWIVQTGMITSIASVLVVITFHIQRHTEIWFAIYMVTAKLYSNSFFVSLNFRRRWQDAHSTAKSSLWFGTAPHMNISVLMVPGTSFREACDDRESVYSAPPIVSLDLGSEYHASDIDPEALQFPSPPGIAVAPRIRY